LNTSPAASPVKRLPFVLAALFVVLTAAAAAAAPSAVTLVETAPVGTTLNHPGVPDAWELWPEMMDGAKARLDVASFYFSNEPGGRLEPVIQAMERAGARGVAVRVLSDAGFYKTYPHTLDRLAKAPGVEVRLVDYRNLAGGVMHAKYFVVDDAEAYIGSQNMDWRSLEHIHEIGLRIQLPDYARVLDRVFDMDWSVAQDLDSETGKASENGGSASETAASAAIPPAPFPYVEASGDTARLWPAMSPRGFLPDSTTWDLPQILEALGAAKDSVHVTVLTYSPVSRDDVYWPELDDALRAAAVRGVKVELMVADWSKRKPVIDHLKSLVTIPNLSVRMVTIPEAASGFIPYARVTHAKYMTVDGHVCWVGTGNWEHTYFYNTRNVGVIVHGRELPAGLDRDFNDLWSGPYAYDVKCDATYEVPKIGD
jgi:phosphatidylserine/phosphatidylglycerophosphate/cardiolipin synthase-like enzyme